jgi:hypothetical protein
LVALHGEEVPGVPGRGPPAGGLARRVPGSRGDHSAGQVEAARPRREPADFVGLAIDAGLGEHHAGVPVQGGERVRPAAAA